MNILFQGNIHILFLMTALYVFRNVHRRRKEITIPDTLDGYKVSELGRNIFGENSAETIVIPSSVEYISAENPFVQCSNLKEIKINGDSEYYCSADGVLFTKDMKKLVCYPQAKEGTNFNIPENTEEVGIAAFYGTKLTDIKVSDSVKKNRQTFLCIFRNKIN